MVRFHPMKAAAMYYVVYYVVQYVMQNKSTSTSPFMYELVPVVGEIMKDFYPEVQKRRFIAKVIKNEEERFHETLHDG